MTVTSDKGASSASLVATSTGENRNLMNHGPTALALGIAFQICSVGSIYAGAPLITHGLSIVALALIGYAAACFILINRSGAKHRQIEGQEQVRIRGALDACKTNVMIADERHDIIYMNKTMLEMMRAAEIDLRKDIPALDSSKLIGASIDAFHKNPAHQRLILDKLTSSIETDIEVGGRSFHLIVTPIFEELGQRRVGTVVEWQDQTEMKISEHAAFRVRTALDSCNTNIMVADDKYNIVYMNNTMLQMMQAAEADMRKDIPTFDSRKLIGANIDVFHKNPAHQRRILDTLTSTVEADIKIGGRSFHLVVTPIIDKSGRRHGTTVEWKDETAEKAIETEISDVVRAAVDGDLTKRVSLDGKLGFMLNLANSMNALCDKISEFVHEIKYAAQEVSNASAEISTSTTDLSQRTEEQAASLEQTSSSMEEISATVRKNAENAQAADRSASCTREVAERGGQVVAKAIDAMAKIEESSGKISDIIGVIDEIARQTNLLALNAAVEAARAGEAGRGFAVVASEVRSLAQRSSQAAKDIKDLITNSNGQVKEGVDLVNRAGASLSEIVDSVKKVAEIVADIANASAEQSGGIEQVGKALTQMDDVTQQNSALVEENAATAKTLEYQAKAMDERIAFFQLNSAAGGGYPAQPENMREQRTVVATPAAPQAAPPKRQAVEPSKRAAVAGRSSGPVGRMQAGLALALKQDPDWKEF